MTDFSTILSHIEGLSNGSESATNEELVNDFADRLTLDKSLITENEEETVTLLQTTVATLMKDNLDIDFAPLITLLDAILSQLSYDTISHQLDVPYVLEALASPNPNIQIIALKVISKAHPVDIIANTGIIHRVFEILSKAETPVAVVSEAEGALEVLFRGVLVRRRAMSDSTVDVLLDMKESGDPILVGRVLNILTLLLPRVESNEAPHNLYQFDILDQKDVLVLLTLIKFYTDVVDITQTHLDKSWLMADVVKQIDDISQLYADRANNIDVEYFAVTSIEELFAKVSYASPDFFGTLETKYISIAKQDTFLLSHVNPSFLASNKVNVLKQLKLTIDTIPIFRHLMSDKTAFDIIQPQLTSTQILRLPYLEIMAITSKLTEYEYTVKYLLNELPQVMNKLLKGNSVIENETWQLRRLTLENLMHVPHDVLNVWHAAVQLEYDKIVKGRPVAPQVEVLDDAL
ncbi:CYFA0S18e00496g1_1 [Cyberlindnera fabianii]|uniref:DNA mismatch repair protein HSM3 n=1 Tax=Cyberlindnera fabianii TaxID=36022 RepID=A0A061BEJ8_CYBFA|nr:CYFA0S18e00496g1_1 [Cyberlindnera fabianii]